MRSNDQDILNPSVTVDCEDGSSIQLEGDEQGRARMTVRDAAGQEAEVKLTPPDLVKLDDAVIEVSQ